MTTAAELLAVLESMANPINVEGMARFGINPHNTLGISIYELRKLAKGLRDHALAEELWQSGIHEVRILASYIDDPSQVTEDQLERWVLDFDSWDVCDQVCDLFGRTPFAVKKVFEWSARREEWVKRAGFVLIAELAAHDKSAPDELFVSFLPVIEREAWDGRNFVKKAVNWALRNIGKRNEVLRQAAMAAARQVIAQDTPSARWIGRDALRELEKHSSKR